MDEVEAMQKKGFISPIALLFWYGTFLLVWLLFAAEQIHDWGLQAVADNHMTGLEALGYSNINSIVFGISLIMLIMLLRYGGE